MSFTINHSEIQSLVANARIIEAIDLFAAFATNTNNPELQGYLKILESRYENLKEQIEKGNLLNINSSQEQAIISHSLLELLNSLNEKGDGPKGNNEARNKIVTQTILFLSSNPTETGKLQLEKEFVQISQSLQGGNVELKLISEWAITPNDLQKAMLNHKPRIIHFSGHGTQESKGGLLLQNIDGNAQVVPGNALANMFNIFSKKFRIEIVLLNACHTKEQAEAISQYVKYVIGMSENISDNAAIGFSAGFYRGLSSDEDIQSAFDMAVNMIELENLPFETIPKLYVFGKLRQ